MKAQHQIKRNTLSAAITTALVVAAASSNAMAQEQSGVYDDLRIEEIVVTATRREELLSDIPYNISAISGSMIEDFQIQSNEELMRAIPGVTMVDQGQRNNGVVNHIVIRGLNVSSSAFGDYALSTVPTVSTYVNDTPVFANFLVKDLERVEVLRGPQGTLYGSGSLGGTVRYITRRPVLGEFRGSVDGFISSTDGSDGNNWEANAMLNIPIGDTFAVRVLGSKLDYAGIVDTPNLYVLDGQGIPVAPDGPLALTDVYESKKDADTVEIDFWRISALWEPNDKFDALFTYQKQKDDIGGRRMITKGADGWGDQYGKYEQGTAAREPSSRELDLTSLEMSLDLGFATLTSSTSYYDHSGESTSENTGFYAQLNWLSAFYYNYPRPMAEALRSYDDEAFVQEVRLVSNTDGAFDWVAGLFYQDQDKGATQYSWLRGFKNWTDAAWGPGAVVGDNDFRYDRRETFKDKAVFGELTWRATDRFRLTGGLRYFDNSYRNTTNMGVGLYTAYYTEDVATFSGGDSDFLFKVNAAWDINDDNMLYGTVSEGYRRGGANAVPLSGNFAEDPAWQRFGPDSVTNYEVGLKGIFNRVRYTASVFYIDWSDIQVDTSTTNGGFFAAVNAGDATSKGVELAFNGSTNNGINWGLGYSYVDATLDDQFYDPTGVPIFGAGPGAKLPSTPESTFNLALDKSFAFDNGLYLTPRVFGYYQSKTENTLGGGPRIEQTLDGFSLWDFSATLGNDRWYATFYVKNAFNEEGSTGVFKEEAFGTDPTQNYYGNSSKWFIAVPRTYGIALGYYF